MKETARKGRAQTDNAELARKGSHSSGPVYRSYEDLPLTLKVEDLMPILNIGRNTAYSLVRSGEIRTIRVGRQLRIPKKVLIEYLNRTQQK